MPTGKATRSRRDNDGRVSSVADSGSHKMAYAYIDTGDNAGKLETIKLYKTLTESNANLIGQVDYDYYLDSTNDNGGTTGDLQLVTVKPASYVPTPTARFRW